MIKPLLATSGPINPPHSALAMQNHWQFSWRFMHFHSWRVFVFALPSAWNILSTPFWPKPHDLHSLNWLLCLFLKTVWAKSPVWARSLFPVHSSNCLFLDSPQLYWVPSFLSHVSCTQQGKRHLMHVSKMTELSCHLLFHPYVIKSFFFFPVWL